MPIISTVGRKSLKMRLLILFVYAVLITGSATTVYPFMLMLGSSVTSLVDYQEYRVVPRYLYSDSALRIKHLDNKYRPEQFDVFKLRYRVDEPVAQVMDGETLYHNYGQVSELENVLPAYDTDSEAFKAKVSDWNEFLAGLPGSYKDTFYQYRILLGDTQIGFQKFLADRYGTVENLRVQLGEMVTSIVEVDPPFEAYDRHAWYPSEDRKARDWYDYRETLPERMMNPVIVRPLYQKYLLDKYVSIEALNAAWGADYRYFWQAPFPSSKPAGAEGEDWEAYVRKRIPLRYVRMDARAAAPAFAAFLVERFGTIGSYNGKVGVRFASFEEVPLGETMPASPVALQVWQDFYEQRLPLDALVLDTADTRYADYLRGKYGAVEKLNAAYGTEYGSFADAAPPYAEADYQEFQARKSKIRRNFMTRNYRFVIERVFLQGRPIVNTLILVLLTVGCAVTVNPLAAYALSRYRLTYAPKILIFMLATMAFPAEVAMIPNFLMIKQLGLLNSFAALILPGLANGYSIFLLKGFFDSLPQELYEAASIDGASEFRMFWMITMPLSLPILSVIALFAFSGAYGSFIWAFTVCQDSRMWTLMVFLQQFQGGMGSHQYVVLASLVLAAIPTIVVFLSAQKVLMKGIVVPTMK